MGHSVDLMIDVAAMRSVFDAAIRAYQEFPAMLRTVQTHTDSKPTDRQPTTSSWPARTHRELAMVEVTVKLLVPLSTVEDALANRGRR